MDMMLIKKGGMIYPYLEVDKEKLRPMPNGQPFRAKITKVSKRSLEFHQMYWAGLLAFTLDYWEPAFNYVSQTEVTLLEAFVKRIYKLSGSDGMLDEPLVKFIEDVTENRRARVETEKTAQKLEAIHQWVKIEAGYYTPELTPTGIQKKVMSISWNSMDQEEFNKFYKAAFNVVWRFVLSRHMTEEEAESAINKLLSMG